ncbi:MAG: methyltransferase domain-containing protein [Planctomycetes bacterium]|nr:methyltransferase domain-containing protein [Planctomycetota bacterium]
MTEINLPKDFDWQHWCERFDQMQEGYIIHHQEIFEIISQLVKTTQGESPRILDLGCGCGTLTLKLLESIPESKVMAVDLDPAMLALARPRLECFGDKAQIIEADLRKDD